MRMIACPNCGAANSERRNSCFRCQRALAASGTVVESEPRPAPGPASRWDALSQEMQGRRGPPPDAASVESRSASQSEAAAEQTTAATRARRLRTGGALVGGAERAEPTERAAARPAPAVPVGPLSAVYASTREVRQASVFFRQFQTLAQAGVPLTEAFAELARRSPRGYRAVAGEMREAASAGRPVSSVMLGHPTRFLSWQVGLVRAAEVGGFLPQALEGIASGLEAEWEFRSLLFRRVMYFLFFVTPALLLALPAPQVMRMPIPQEGLNLSIQLQRYTQLLLHQSLPIALGLAAVFILLRLAARLELVQRLVHLAVLFGGWLNPVARLARDIAIGRYCSTLGLLLQAGVPVGEAAETAAGAAGNFVLESRLRGVARLLRSGTPLGAALGQTRLLDPEAIGLIGVGETTGDLPSMLERAANLHSQQVPLRLEGLSRSLHLAMLLFFAVLVAALVLKFFLAYWLEFPYRVYDWMVGE